VSEKMPIDNYRCVVVGGRKVDVGAVPSIPDPREFPYMGDLIIMRPATKEDMIECALVRLRGAITRLDMVLEHRAEHAYEIGMQAVESAMAGYREALK
jgi:hypothetical protein